MLYFGFETKNVTIYWGSPMHCPSQMNFAKKNFRGSLFGRYTFNFVSLLDIPISPDHCVTEDISGVVVLRFLATRRPFGDVAMVR